MRVLQNPTLSSQAPALRVPRETTSGAVAATVPEPAPFGHVPSVVSEVVASPGARLDASSRAFAESRFGRDFSGVRIHTDSKAATSAAAVQADAYTVGQHIAFAAGRHAPHEPKGRNLLMHELAHTVQQSALRQFPDAGQSIELGSPADALEQQADAAAADVSRGAHLDGTAERLGSVAVPRLQRTPSQGGPSNETDVSESSVLRDVYLTLAKKGIRFSTEVPVRLTLPGQKPVNLVVDVIYYDNGWVLFEGKGDRPQFTDGQKAVYAKAQREGAVFEVTGSPRTPPTSEKKADVSFPLGPLQLDSGRAHFVDGRKSAPLSVAQLHQTTRLDIATWVKVMELTHTDIVLKPDEVWYSAPNGQPQRIRRDDPRIQGWPTKENKSDPKPLKPPTAPKPPESDSVGDSKGGRTDRLNAMRTGSAAAAQRNSASASALPSGVPTATNPSPASTAQAGALSASASASVAPTSSPPSVPKPTLALTPKGPRSAPAAASSSGLATPATNGSQAPVAKPAVKPQAPTAKAQSPVPSAAGGTAGATTPAPAPPKPEAVKNADATKSPAHGGEQNARNAQALGGLASVAVDYIQSGLERSSAGEARFAALEEFQKEQAAIFDELWHSPEKGMDISFHFIVTTPKSGQPARVQYQGKCIQLLEHRGGAMFRHYDTPKARVAEDRELRVSPGIRDEFVSLWIANPYANRRDRKTPTKPGAPEASATPVATFNDFVQKTTLLTKGDLSAYELSAYESLKQSAPTLTAQVTTFEAHRFEVPHSLHAQLLDYFAGRIFAKLSKKLHELEGELVSLKGRLESRLSEGTLSKVINSRGDLALDPKMLWSTEAHLVSARGTVQNGAFRHAQESLAQASALLNQSDLWLRHYDGKPAAWDDSIQ